MAGAKNGSAGVRVCARFRPQNKLELKQQAVEVVQLDDDATVRIANTIGNAHTFTFDRVFGIDSTQADVYAATAQPLVQAALQGYNCTCFVYGQTGTGKTFSMEGVPGDKDYAGIIPRVMDDIFDGIENMQAELEFIVRVSYVEIYLEKIRDLLKPSSNNLSVRESRERGVWVAGATEVCCASADEMMAVMRLGGANRVIASTRMNNDSSRSHSVFIITVEQRNVSTGSTKSGKLFLVDLAGSEKVGKTQAKGQTLKEAQHINKSLSALGSVMNALTSGQANAHIPYRDSKLTRLLQDSLGGNSDTTLLVCGSCSSYNAEETLTTLRFGQRAKSIKNKPKVNEERTVAEYKQILLEKEQVIAALQAQIQKMADSPMTVESPDGSIETPEGGETDATTIQELLAKLAQLEDEQVSKMSENASLEERVAELESKQHEWQSKELAFTKMDQRTEELTSQLAFLDSELAAKGKECEQLQMLLHTKETLDDAGASNHTSRSYRYSDADAMAPPIIGALPTSRGALLEKELLRQQLGAKSAELEICTTRMHALAEELGNCRGFYENQISVLQQKLHEYESHVMGFMALGESDDKTTQLDSLLQKNKTLRSVRGGRATTRTSQNANGVGTQTTPTKQLREALAAASTNKKKASDETESETYHRPRFVSAASTEPDGWAIDNEIFPMAPIDMDSPIVQRLIASMPEKGREKMYKWLVFVLEGRDIRAHFHPEISMEGINDEISRDMRRLIIPLLKKRQDIEVESYVRTRFVKVSDLKIKLVHRHRDTMHLESTVLEESTVDGDAESSEHNAVRRSSGPHDLGKRWAKDHLFYGPKSDPASESVLHVQRTPATTGRLDRFVSEPVDMSASILESKTILTSGTTGAPTSSASRGSSLTKETSAPNGLASAPNSSRDGSGLGGMFSRFRAHQTSVSLVLGDVKSALTARYNKHHVHDDTMCDGCGASPIVGAKWKCNTCENYELCDACYGVGMHGCEISLEMCRRVEQAAAQKHRVLGQYPELFELLRAHICGDDVIHFRQIVEWLCDIVGGKSVAHLRQRSIVKSGLHPEIRARLVAQLGAVASERTDLELKTEWFIEVEEEEEEQERGDDTEDESQSSKSGPRSDDGGKETEPEASDFDGASIDSAPLETLRMYVIDVGALSEVASVGSSLPPLSGRKLSERSTVASVTSDEGNHSVVSASGHSDTSAVVRNGSHSQSSQRSS